MKAIAVIPKKREVALVDEPEPRIASPTDVLVRILDVGVCGTDREICTFEYGTPPPGSDRLVLGHEAFGEVLAVGDRVTKIRPGDLVVPIVRRPCPHAHCQACRAGMQDFCYTGEFAERGIHMAGGFMTERVVDDERFFVPVPPELRDVGVLTEPLTIAEKALRQVWSIQQRLPWMCDKEHDGGPGGCRRAVVLGAGPVGLLGAMALARSGFATYVYSREKAPSPKSAIVEAIGGTYVSAEEASPSRLAAMVGNIDLVYEASGASAASFRLMSVLGTNGVFVFTGVPGRKGPISFEADLHMRQLVLKNQAVFGTVNAGRDAYEAAIRDLGEFRRRWPDALGALITGRFGPEAYRELLVGPPSGIKNVIAFGGRP